jgi:hypothetical protein
VRKIAPDVAESSQAYGQALSHASSPPASFE